MGLKCFWRWAIIVVTSPWNGEGTWFTLVRVRVVKNLLLALLYILKSPRWQENNRFKLDRDKIVTKNCIKKQAWIIAKFGIISFIMWRLRGSIGRAFCSDNQLALQKYYKSNPSLKGSCSALGSLKYSRRNSKVHKDHWSNPVGLIEQLKISSLGVGTFGAIPTAEQDLVMFNSLVSSLTSGGVNLVDTCCVYR